MPFRPENHHNNGHIEHKGEQLPLPLWHERMPKLQERERRGWGKVSKVFEKLTWMDLGKMGLWAVLSATAFGLDARQQTSKALRTLGNNLGNKTLRKILEELKPK